MSLNNIGDYEKFVKTFKPDTNTIPDRLLSTGDLFGIDKIEDVPVEYRRIWKQLRDDIDIFKQPFDKNVMWIQSNRDYHEILTDVISKLGYSLADIDDLGITAGGKLILPEQLRVLNNKQPRNIAAILLPMYLSHKTGNTLINELVNISTFDYFYATYKNIIIISQIDFKEIYKYKVRAGFSDWLTVDKYRLLRRITTFVDQLHT